MATSKTMPRINRLLLLRRRLPVGFAASCAIAAESSAPARDDMRRRDLVPASVDGADIYAMAR